MTRTALIVYGGLELHQPQLGAARTRDILEANGFRVTMTADYDALGDAIVRSTDLVVPVITGGQIDPERLKVLVDAVASGTGLAGFHHCMATSFREYVAFRYMAGCTWVAHPGDIITYRVDIAAPDDPIMAGITSFEHTSEQYYLHYDPAVEILATTTFSGDIHPWRKNIVMPVVYKTHYDKGRVFYSSLGHRADELDIPNIRAIWERGLLWAARAG